MCEFLQNVLSKNQKYFSKVMQVGLIFLYFSDTNK